MKENKFTQVFELIDELLPEVKRMDDKLMLTELFLSQSKAHFRLKNLDKCKASLTAAKTNANVIHCPPLLQAEIDLHSGNILAAEKDYATSYSYFYEAFEQFKLAAAGSNSPHKIRSKGSLALSMMMLAKIMMNRQKDLGGISQSKAVLKFKDDLAAHQGEEPLENNMWEGLTAIAKALDDRNLKLFSKVVEDYPELSRNVYVSGHISELHETLFEKNLLRVIEPYSSVDLSHLSRVLDLGHDRISRKLQTMILDQKLEATLDQENDMLLVLVEEEVNLDYSSILGIIGHMSQVTDNVQKLIMDSKKTLYK